MVLLYNLKYVSLAEWSCDCEVGLDHVMKIMFSFIRNVAAILD